MKNQKEKFDFKILSKNISLLTAGKMKQIKGGKGPIISCPKVIVE